MKTNLTQIGSNVNNETFNLNISVCTKNGLQEKCHHIE